MAQIVAPPKRTCKQCGQGGQIIFRKCPKCGRRYLGNKMYGTVHSSRRGSELAGDSLLVDATAVAVEQGHLVHAGLPARTQHSEPEASPDACLVSLVAR